MGMHEFAGALVYLQKSRQIRSEELGNLPQRSRYEVIDLIKIEPVQLTCNP